MGTFESPPPVWQALVLRQFLIPMLFSVLLWVGAPCCPSTTLTSSCPSLEGRRGNTQGSSPRAVRWLPAALTHWGTPLRPSEELLQLWGRLGVSTTETPAGEPQEAGRLPPSFPGPAAPAVGLALDGGLEIWTVSLPPLPKLLQCKLSAGPGAWTERTQVLRVWWE